SVIEPAPAPSHRVLRVTVRICHEPFNRLALARLILGRAQLFQPRIPPLDASALIARLVTRSLDDNVSLVAPLGRYGVQRQNRSVLNHPVDHECRSPSPWILYGCPAVIASGKAAVAQAGARKDSDPANKKERTL